VPITWGYDKKAAEVYTHDPERAKQLLEGAGWKVGPDGIRQKDGQRLEVILGTWENGVAEVIQAQFRDVGIDYRIQVAPVVATNEAARREQVHMSPIPNARSDPDALSTNHSRNRGAGNEFTFHSNARLDELFDAGASATNNDDRARIYGEIQMILMQDAMYLPVFHRDSVSAARSEVEGMVFDRGFFPLLHNTSIKK
jgi:peptide/nickel transport system substrate-binding protein